MFQKHLLAGETRVIGRFDARITGFDPEPVASFPTYDPSLSGYLPVYSSTFNDYVRRGLRYDSVLPYEVLSNKVGPWRFGNEGHGYLNMADTLRSAMIKNPHLRVLFCSGYFDEGKSRISRLSTPSITWNCLVANCGPTSARPTTAVGT